MQAAPGLREVVVWGLCDAASAALFYARGDARVCGLVLLNPWARSELGAARATLRHYYLQRLRSKELWHKIYRRDFDYSAAARSLCALLATLLRRRTPAPLQPAAARRSEAITPALHQRLLAGFAGFSGQVLLVISAKDLAAQEFLALAGSTRQWRRLMGSARVTRCTLPDADHTFSSYAWRNQVADCTVNWIRSW
jgi:exosortase A-associated hydrolase 1